MLANADEPLVLADGTKIDPKTGSVIREKRSFVEVPSNTQAQRQVAATRRRLADLPAPPKTMNAVSVVVSYTLFGLSDTDMAIATGMTVEQIERIKELDAFKSMLDTVSNNIVSNDVDDVRTMFKVQAKHAATKLVELADSENEVVALKASQDILDRAGHRPADVVEHRHAMDGGLTIKVIKQDNTVKAPEIDLDPTDITEVL
jgi:hypothetical protein